MSKDNYCSVRSSSRPFWMLGLVVLLITTTAWAVAADDSGDAGDETSASLSALPSKESGKIVREGQKVKDLIGTFRISGDRANFYTLDGRRLGGLENLALERISVTTNDNQSLTWRVSGIITEYKGTNFILVSHAVVKSRGGDQGSSRSSGRGSR